MMRLMREAGWSVLLLAAVAMVSAAEPCAGAEPIVVDGRFGDWGDGDPAAVDPPGDAEGAFDLQRVHLASRGADLYVRFEIGRSLSLQSGPEDEGTLRLRVSEPGSEDRLTIDFRGRRITLLRNNEQTRLRWPGVRYVIAPTHAAEAFEVRLNLDRLGVESGDRVAVQFGGSDRLDEAVRFELREPRAPKRWRSPERAEAADLRLASFNVQRDGLSDPERREKIGRLLRAVEPGVLCLQEIYDPDAGEVARALEELTGGEDGGRWHAHKHDDNVVAARWPVVGIESEDHGYAAAAVKHPDHGPVVVLSAHTRCCGYKGSEEDERRIEQAEAMAETVRRVREAEPGTPLHPFRDAPVVLAGDVNLVGSTEPLRVLSAEPAPGLKRWRLRSLDGRSVMSWVNPGSTFVPGVLDMMLYDNDRLRGLHGFILDSRRLNDRLLEALGLKRDDSEASDHLVLVGDFAVR